MAGDSIREIVERSSLADLARGGVLSFGDGYRTMQSELGSAGFPILRVSQVADGFIRPTSSMEWVRQEFRRSIGPKLSRPDDVVLTTKGTFGRRAYVRPEDADYVYSPQVCWFRVVDPARIDPRYLYSWLGSSDFANQARGMKSSTDMADYLSLGDLARVSVPLPSLPEQRAIAHVLGTLDDKIELNRRMNETLESIARNLFKSWFVDFDPVRAKSQGRDPGLPPHLADLFPDAFEGSALGEIPNGWRVGKAGELAVLTRDACAPGDFPEETFDHFSIPAFDDGRMPKVESGASIKSNKFLVPAESVLVSKLNPRIPRIWMPSLDGPHRAICSTEFLVALPRAGVSREFLLCLFSSDAFASVFETLATGTSGSHQRVRPEGFLAIDVVIPGQQLVRQFTNAVQPALARIDRSRAESNSLSALRDTLLPRLVSGQLRLDDTHPRNEAWAS